MTLHEASLQHFKATLNVYDLFSLGLGNVVGAGIFSLTGIAAAQFAGPAIGISFIIGAFICAFPALAYCEFGAMMPVSGSAYSYLYPTIGEFLAYVAGWDLIFEYLISGSAVAAGWSSYLQAFFRDASGGKIASFYYPIVNAPFTWIEGTDGGSGSFQRLCNDAGECGIINLPAMGICLAMTIALVIGMKESATSGC